MPRGETEWAGTGERGVDAPGGCPVAYNRSVATSTLGLDGGDNTWRQSRPFPARRCGEEGRGTSWRRRCASSPPPRRMARRRLRGTRIARLTRSAGEQTHQATAQPRARSLTATSRTGRTTWTTARHLTGARATSPGTAGRRATFPSTAMLLYERVDDGDGCVVVVECIAVAVASLCGFAGAEASPARRRAHEIVEMMRRRQRRGSTVGRTGPRQQRRQR